MKLTKTLFSLFLSFIFSFSFFDTSFAAQSEWQSNEYCMMCHSDASLKSSDNRKMFVTSEYSKSAHGNLNCIDCHSAGNYDDVPHYTKYTPVNCDDCHEGITENWRKSVHGTGGGTSPFIAAQCKDCHTINGDMHRIGSNASGVAGLSCTKCHSEESKQFQSSKHFKVFPSKDGHACATCHKPHGEIKLNDPVSITKTCQNCHIDAMARLKNGPHGIHGIHQPIPTDSLVAKVSCSSCHDPHGIPNPKKSNDAFSNCLACHHKSMNEFSESVHMAKLISQEMTCASCHSIHLRPNEQAFHCGDCHSQQLEEYKRSMHFRDDPTGLGVAANCGDCHDGGHGVRRVTDRKSMAHPFNQPQMCGKCHGDSLVLTSDFVRLPMTLSNYMKSIHAEKWQAWKQDTTLSRGALCTDCHGTHEIQSAGDPASITHRQNLPRACGKCHEQAAADYLTSIHGAAARRGITDSPTCNDCHESHYILPKSNPASRTYPLNIASDCGRCHENRALTDRFGIWYGVVKSYQDSYHGWALKGSQIVANCNDCHTTHAIRSHLDPTSSTHPNHVIQTCGKCHPNSNAEFAQSYTHAAFGQVWGKHDYVRVIYIVLIALTLGGMLIHNVIIFVYYLREHYHKHKKEDYIVRMSKQEIWQHLLLLFTFIGLAITGFALRFADSWWVKILNFFGMNEIRRATTHRVLAITLLIGTVWHVIWLFGTQRGREKLKNYYPKIEDTRLAFQNVLYYLRLRKDPPHFGTYDYTQKAEYWALVWGTIIMGLTGFILWFPTIITSWAPGWIVRVSGVIHYYEAILAVGAILIWHFFFVIFHPKQYPLSLTFLTGRMSKEEWEHHHRKAAEATLGQPNFVHPGDPDSDTSNHLNNADHIDQTDLKVNESSSTDSELK
ncbi:MAG: cytochrome b/b6 domain-containing protein [bacterium]|nr:cytochrome b/b6 domain-containing protein [bacterium]